MNPASPSFPAVLISLWLRLTTIAAIGLLFIATPQLPPLIAGWVVFQSTPEIVFELAVRVVFVAMAGVALATVCTAVVSPFLLFIPSSRLRIAQTVTELAVALTAFADLSIVAKMAVGPLIRWVGLRWFPVMTLYSIAFALALCLGRWRKQILHSLDGFLGERTTRRVALAMGIAAAGLAAGELIVGRVASARATPVQAAQRPRPNILLITFDALSAEDMSLYGYRLPTTPNIDGFARTGSVFTNVYSTSTFTTPGVASILTGLYPSEHRVYQLAGRLRGDKAVKTLPHLMRRGGYAAGASVANPFAYFLTEDLAADFDALPEPAYYTMASRLWHETKILHQHQPYGSRCYEFWDLEAMTDSMPKLLERYSPRLFAQTKSPSSPAADFAQAREVLGKLPDGFFMWVHIFAPHGPYLPSAPWLGRFLPSGEMRTAADQIRGPLWPEYKPEAQPLIDKARLRYDEYIAEADHAFGDFLGSVEASGKLRNTAVIVAADHGESFEGGLYIHGSEFQTRPEIHIPLIIRMPGQRQGRRIAMTLDLTALPVTLLDIAGLPRPDWMQGRSLLPWLNQDLDSGATGQSEGLAFTQYLATDSVFRPLHSGTVGIVDGRSQYVVNLATGKGILRNLSEANKRNLDRSAENPALAQTMRAAIYARFPELPR